MVETNKTPSDESCGESPRISLNVSASTTASSKAVRPSNSKKFNWTNRQQSYIFVKDVKFTQNNRSGLTLPCFGFFGKNFVDIFFLDPNRGEMKIEFQRTYPSY